MKDVKYMVTFVKGIDSRLTDMSNFITKEHGDGQELYMFEDLITDTGYEFPFQSLEDFLVFEGQIKTNIRNMKSNLVKI